MEKLTIPHLFRQTVMKRGDKNALGKKDTALDKYTYITYNELAEKVDRFSSAMLELGVAPTEKVAIMSENCPEWVISDLSLISIAALDVPVYPTLTYSQLEYILNNCAVKGIIVSNDTHYQKVVKNFEAIPSLEFVININDVKKVEHTRIKTISFQEALELGASNLEKNRKEIEQKTNSIKEDDVCSIIYTSGTTGDPKGVMLTNKNFISNVIACTNVLFPTINDETELSFLPLSHVFERIVYYLMFYLGGTIAYAESIETISKNLAEVKPTVMGSVPRIFEKIHSKIMEGINSAPPLRQKIFYWALKVGKEYYEANKFGGLSFFLEMEHKLADKMVFSKIREKTGGNLQVTVSGGAPLMKEMSEFFAYIGLPIIEGYGLTETSPVICLGKKSNLKFGYIGAPIADVEVKIAEDGEVLARGPNIMKGYYNNPKATEEAIDQDGWFRTGDIGELDSENFLKITDRKKELIVMSNGKNVAPQPIENLLKTSNYIEQIAVIGDNRKFISALIVPKFENLLLKAKELGVSTVDKTEICKEPKIIAFFKTEIEKISADKIARYEQLKKFCLLCEEFSLEKSEITPTLKLKRKVIAQNFKESIEAMYESELTHSN